jgi:hypothetical protein
MSDIAPAAYMASLSFEKNPDKPAHSQRALVSELHDRQFQKLCEEPHELVHATDCGNEGNYDFMRSNKNVDPLPDAIVGAVLRTRMAVPHRDIKRRCGGRPKCPGCNKEQLDITTNEHLAGCARIMGRNCSARHAGLKCVIGQICNKLGVQHESKEPQGYEMRKCNSCSAIFPDAATEEHLASHPQCSADKILPASSIRPDKRLQLKDPKSKAPLNVVIDVSGVAAIGRELSWSTETRLDARHRRKLQLYEQAAKANDDIFMTFCITPNGTMNPDAEKAILPQNTLLR